LGFSLKDPGAHPTASSLNSRVNFRRSMTHLPFH
jgi:hypothetical protein